MPPDDEPKMPIGVAVDLAHFQRTRPDEWASLPPGTSFRAHRRGPGVWVLVYRLPGGSIEERHIPRWQADANLARELRGAFRIVR